MSVIFRASIANRALFALSAFVAFGNLPLIGSDHVSATLLSDQQSVVKGEPFNLAIKMSMRDHWHTYWENPGSSGLPTTVTWDLPDGLQIGPLQFPIPQRFVDAAGFITYGYDADTHLVARATYLGDAQSILIKGTVEWLECKEICIPGKQEVALELNVGQPQPSQHAKAIARAQTQVPVTYSSTAPFDYLSVTKFKGSTWNGTIKVTPKDGQSSWDPSTVRYFPGTNPHGELKNTSLRMDGSALILDLTYEAWEEQVPSEWEMDGVLVLGNGPNSAYRIAVYPDRGDIASSFSTAPSRKGMLIFLLMAFAGGIILNLMPCVLPVLSLKVMSFISEAGESSARRLQFGLVYTAGIMASFLVLSSVIVGLKLAGERVGIGFQFQSIPFVIFMIVLLFAMSLSFFGVFSIQPPSASGLTGLTSKGGLAGAFLNGILMTLLSTPCTAPLLGPAYGWAMSAANWQLFVVFQAVAMGLAAPYLALCTAPILLRYLPKPGVWMNDLKVFMGFPLIGTVVWLLWVLGNLGGGAVVIGTLAFLNFIAMGLWIGGRTFHGQRRHRGVLAAVAMVALGSWLGMKISAPSDIDWKPYDAAALSALRQDNQVVFMDFTAEWCATCKFNEKLVIDTQTVRDTFDKNNVVPVKVDYTHYDREITLMLQDFGRAGVPLYVVYPGNSDPIVLPEVITKTMVVEAIRDATAIVNQRSAL